MNIHQNDISDVLKFLPGLSNFDSNQSSDFIICTLGFEDRTHQILDSLLSSSFNHHKKLILVKYPTNRDDNLKNYDYFVEAGNKLENLIEIDYSKSNFYNDFKKVIENNVPENSRVIFDISTCSSYLFYPIFKALIDSNIHLTISYTEALVYYPTQEQWKEVEDKAKRENQLFVKSWDDADFQSVGIDDIYGSNLFAEMNPGNKPSLLIAIPNFNSIRMQSIKEKDNDINKTDSNTVKWLIGMPPEELNRWRAEALLKTNNLEAINPNNLNYISTLNYKETLKTLETIWIESKYNFHISIGSLGSKMQHLGTFFFIYLHPDVGLWLAEPKEFKAKVYSDGCGKIHQIDIGSTKELREKLANYMQFEWEY